MNSVELHLRCAVEILRVTGGLWRHAAMTNVGGIFHAHRKITDAIRACARVRFYSRSSSRSYKIVMYYVYISQARSWNTISQSSSPHACVPVKSTAPLGLRWSPSKLLTVLLMAAMLPGNERIGPSPNIYTLFGPPWIVHSNSLNVTIIVTSL